MKVMPVLVGFQSMGTLAVTAGVLFLSMRAPPPEHATPAASHEPAAASGEHGAAAAGARTYPPGPAGVRQALLDGNERFVADTPSAHQFVAERKGLTKGQHPKAMVLSCSDSRLPPELIFDQTLGDLFVVRSAGNVADKIGLASLEYGAEHLHAKVLLVLGHEKCGAVTAAAKGDPMPTENLQALMDELAPSLKGLREKYQGEQLVHLGVEANVDQTATEVLDRSPLLKRLVLAGELEVLRGVYDLESGKVRLLGGAAPPEAPAGEVR